MGEKLVGLRKIKDLEFVKEKMRYFGILDILTHFRNFRD